MREVLEVDDESRQIWFAASGMNAGEDPYFVHYYRIGFDGTGLTALTEAEANHQVVLSSDREYYVERVLRPVGDAILSHLGESFDDVLGLPVQLSLL